MELSDYKVGDVVRIVRDTGCGYRAGDIATLIQTYDPAGPRLKCLAGFGSDPIDAAVIELVSRCPEPEPEVTYPRFGKRYPDGLMLMQATAGEQWTYSDESGRYDDYEIIVSVDQAEARRLFIEVAIGEMSRAWNESRYLTVARNLRVALDGSAITATVEII